MILDLGKIIQFINSFMDSGWFIALQILGGIVSLGMFVFIIYLTYQNKNIEIQLRHLWISWKKGPVPLGKMMKRWNRIKEKIESDNSSLWREAILEADFMLDQILRKLGYEGGSTEERLEDARASQFSSLDEALKAHRVADFITEDPEYPLTREISDKTIEIYRNIFRDTGIIL